jgi:septin family protein
MLVQLDVSWRDAEGEKGGGCAMQDTPGLNTQEDLEVVLDYVRAQLQAYMAMEENPRRDLPMSRLADPRVDVALYLIAPHALKRTTLWP